MVKEEWEENDETGKEDTELDLRGGTEKTRWGEKATAGLKDNGRGERSGGRGGGGKN